MERFVLTDARWRRWNRIVSESRRTRVAGGSDNRRFVEAVLWIVRTGSPWRDLPGFFGTWNSVFRRYP